MKYEKDGMVAVLYRPNFGAGWSTWNPEYAEILLFHPLLVEPVDQYEQNLITQHQLQEKIRFALTMLGLDDIYSGTIADLRIFWMRPGSLFRIDEYDGNETVVLHNEQQWITA